MNKRIYFNDKFIEFIDKEKFEMLALQTHTLDEASKSKKTLKFLIEDFLNDKKLGSEILPETQFEELISYFQSNYYYIEAAGGLIQKNDQYLFILRHGLWDLPKGKLEKGESLDHAAIRECEEECAVKDLAIEHGLPSTFHIYPYKNSFALKQSYWYKMRTGYEEKLVPQLAEDITDVQWFKLDEIKNTVLAKTYYTIGDLVRGYLGI